MNIDKIITSKTPPVSKFVGWLKPVNGKSFELNFFLNGAWRPVSVEESSGNSITEIECDATYPLSLSVTTEDNKATIVGYVDMEGYAQISDIPTKTSELENDSDFITSSALEDYAKTEDIPTKTSELENDSDFITSSALDGLAKTSDIPTKTSELTNDSDFITSSALEGYETTADAEKAHTDLEAEITKKQDILSAGTGIDITDNVVSTTIDTNPFVFVDELPTSDIKTGKVYCTPDPESTDEKNIWDEWYWIENEQRWEAVGKYIPTIDLTPYEKIEDAEVAHKELQDSIDTLKQEVEDGYATKDEVPTKVSELENDSSFTTTTDLNNLENSLKGEIQEATEGMVTGLEVSGDSLLELNGSIDNGTAKITGSVDISIIPISDIDALFD